MTFLFYDITDLNINDLVVVEIKNITNFGINVVLLEYNNIEALINLREISTNKYRSLNGLINVGDIEVVQVTNIDIKNENSIFIDLTRKYIDENKKEIIYKNYLLLKKLINKTNKFTLVKDIKNYLIFLELYYPIKIIVDDIKLGNIIIKTKEPLFKNEFDDLIKKIDNIDNEDFNYNFEWYLKSIKETITEPETINKLVNENVQPTVNVGIIGHVAHGKTSLIEALTGVDTRKYKKELESNCTIKLGYTNLRITKCKCDNKEIFISGNCQGNCENVYISLVDCPGHNCLLSTMLSGASIMNSVIMIISGNEKCPQPQTTEHLIAMEIDDTFNNVNNLIVQTKIDTINIENAKESYLEIKRFVKNSFLESSDIIPISSRKKFNIEYILKHLFNSSKLEVNDKSGSDKALIVRNFDINKPGTNISILSGLVLGCSIINGEISVGEQILIVPQNIKTVIKSIKTDDNKLLNAKKGGLIAIETDLNPHFIKLNLIGSMIIKVKDFDKSCLYKTGDILTLKYYTLKKVKCGFKVNDHISLNILSKYIENCEIVKVFVTSKNKIQIKLTQDIYIPNDIDIKAVIIINNRLQGYAKILESKYEKNNQELVQDNKIELNTESIYNELLNNFYDNKMINKIKLPVINLEYSNTFSSITNFNNLSGSLNVTEIILGNYIKTELGMRSVSIRDNNLYLKGRTNIQNVQKVIINYIKEYKLCKCCNGINTIIIKIMNINKINCKDCNYTC